MFKKIIDFNKKDAIKITQDNLRKYFTELDELYVDNGNEVKRLQIYQAQALSPFAELTDYAPIVKVSEGQFVPLAKIKGSVSH